VSVVKVRVELVQVDVAVTDARGGVVSGLAREQFRVFDNGVEQRITHFASVDAPARILLLVEDSPAVYLMYRQHLLAALWLLDGLAPDDAVALAAYDDRLHWQMDLTLDKWAVAAGLDRLHYELGYARLDLFGSLAAALERLAILPEPAPPEGASAAKVAPAKTAVVLLATGLSDVRQDTVRRQLLARLQTAGFPVYAVALGDDPRSLPPKNAAAREAIAAFTQADRDLEEIARASGGRVFFPHTEKDFEPIYREVAATLRHLYSLAFVPQARDGKVHTLRVEVRDVKGQVMAPGTGRDAWRLLARPAYVAAE
jgi:VWFA-related protein